MSPSNESSAASASLIITWSSASNSRTGPLAWSGVIVVHRDRRGQLEAVAASRVGRSERQPAAGGTETFGHAAQAGAPVRAGGLLAGGSAAVVTDLQGQFPVPVEQADPAGLRAGVADHVGHRLAQAPGQHGFGVGVERA